MGRVLGRVRAHHLRADHCGGAAMTTRQRHAFILNPEPTTPSRSGDTRCFIFHWIGQSFMSCEECGEPDFVHPYRPVYGNGRPDFFIKRYHSYRGGFWSWEAVKINEHYDHERALHWCGSKGEQDA